MTVFTLDASTVAAHTDALRADASSLTPLTCPPIPSVGPFAAYRIAVDDALDFANTRALGLVAEARRLAAMMDLTVAAAGAVDGSTCDALEAVL